MKKFFVRAVVYFLCLGILCSLYAAPRKVQRGNESWRSLKKAQDAFEANDFAAAVQFADLAKEIRKQDAEWQTYILEETLKKSKVRHAGDEFDRVIPVLHECGLDEAVKIVESHLEKYGAAFFNGNYSSMIDFIPFFAHYPEADFLLGRIYKLEGEYNVALDYLKNAYEHSASLHVPMEKYDLLYELAEISFDLGNEDDYEKYLLAIAMDDALFVDSGYSRSLTRIVDSGSKDAVEKFFLLYRYENDVALKAFMELTRFYMSKDLSEKALNCSSFASILIVSKLEGVLKERLNDFQYENFTSLVTACAQFADIVDWGSENRVWELFCDFADAAADSGKTAFSAELFAMLSEVEPVEFWQLYAASKAN